VCDDLKTSDLKALAVQIGESRLSLASPDRLMEFLGLEPGAVSLLALVNDPEHHVQVLVDEDLWGEDKLQCHPLTNTATLIISLPEIKRFLELTGHEVELVTI
jgi:Ala-tRNA(Pro) deacylase